LEGIFTAVITPFREDLEVDYELLGDLVAFQEEGGVQGIVPCGTNGEFSSLTLEEAKEVLRRVDEARRRLKVIAGVGRASLPETLELCRWAEGRADALLVVPPYYFKPLPLEGIFRYYRRVLETSGLPVILYHIPKYSGVAITCELLERLGGMEGLYGVKDSSGDLETTRGLREAFPDLRIYGGSDGLIYDTLSLGGPGAISALSNVFPERVEEIYRRFREGGPEGASRSQEALKKVRALFQGFPPRGAIKHALTLRGFRESWVRPPLLDLAPEQKGELERGLETLGWI
jgi:4-hydroxy-tetrahydrodipicolinate synthase